MPKMNRKQKQEEERRIIAEMEGALQGNKSNASKEQTENRAYDDTMPDKIHCKRCKTLMENGVCPTCGFRIYVPMDKKQRDKMKLTLAIVLMTAFVAVFIWTQVKG